MMVKSGLWWEERFEVKQGIPCRNQQGPQPVIAEVTLQTSILRIAQIGAGRKQNP